MRLEGDAMMSMVKRIPIFLLLPLMLSVGCVTSTPTPTPTPTGLVAELGPCVSTLMTLNDPNSPIARVYIDASGRPAVDPEELPAKERNQHAPSLPVVIQW